MMLGARLARVVMIAVTVTVIFGLLVSAFAVPQVF